MLFTWLLLVFQIIVLATLKPFISDLELLGILSVILNVGLTVIILLSSKKKFKYILLLSFLLRLIVMIFDLYFSSVFSLPNSGADTELFYRLAIELSNSTEITLNSAGGIYASFLGLLFRIIGPNRLIAQYINVLFGLSTIWMVRKTLLLTSINTKHVKYSILIVSFIPNTVILSSILLRESIPTFFLSLSLYYYFSWFKENNVLKFMKSMLSILFASMFHSGLFGVSIGLIVAFAISKNGNKDFTTFKPKNFFSTLMVCFIFAGLLFIFGDLILAKFGSISSSLDIFARANTRYGGSSYLNSLKITSIGSFITYIPIKSIYFFSSPVPWDWRGLIDVFSFFSDSIVYIVLIYMIFRRKAKNLYYGKLNKSLKLMLILTSIMFAIGVSNAGTAIRHRQKVLPLIVISYVLSKSTVINEEN